MGKTARLPRMTAVLAAAAAGVIAFSGVLPGTAAPPPQAPVIPGAELAKAFAAAADQYDVPRDLLVALGYAESHLDGHNGKPSQAGGYGMMHLVSNPTNRTLSEATKLTGLPTERVAKESAANIAGAAAVLDSYADKAGLTEAQRDDVDNWYQVVAEYSHSADLPTGKLYADEVFRLIGDGLQVKSGAGAGITISPTKVAPERGKYAATKTMGELAVDYPGAIWSAASTSNYQVANRPASNVIDRIVVHTTQGSYAGTISWFKNPSSQVSAHYVIRSSDGQITQMVREKDIAWHVRSANSRSVGIEHEGWVNDPSWYTDAMYRASAALTKNIADRYGIPKDRTHIVGHSEVPNNDHTDPGPNWNWTYYMSLVTGGGNPPEYNFTTYGSGVNVRSDAKLSASIVTTLAGPTRVYVVCQKEGDAVTAEGTTNKWWSKLRDQNGYMTNIYIDHPDAQLPGVPVCGAGQTINTTGTNVNVRSEPTTASTVLRVLPGPTTQVALCQASGQSVTINGVANSWWAKLQAGGYVSNHYVSGANPKVAGLGDC